MVTMPSAHRTSAACTKVSPGKPRRTKLHPGSLLRTGKGKIFRISKDGTRIHAHKGPRRNVVRLADANGTLPDLPGWFIRTLLNPFGTEPAWARARRTWLVHRDDQGQWYVSLELRSSAQGTLAFPVLRTPATGAPLSLAHPDKCVRVCRKLWAQADAFEKEPAAPATLTLHP